MMLGYAHASFLRAKTTPGRSGYEDKEKQDDPGRRMDESGQAPKRAMARPLKIQPGIQSTEDSSSKRPVARA
jgi:hypothetical protein